MERTKITRLWSVWRDRERRDYHSRRDQSVQTTKGNNLLYFNYSDEWWTLVNNTFFNDMFQSSNYTQKIADIWQNRLWCLCMTKLGKTSLQNIFTEKNQSQYIYFKTITII